jgi:hypothetical protein
LCQLLVNPIQLLHDRLCPVILAFFEGHHKSLTLP